MKATVTIVVTFEDVPDAATPDARLLNINVDGSVDGETIGPGLDGLCKLLIELTCFAVQREMERTSGTSPVVEH